MSWLMLLPWRGSQAVGHRMAWRLLPWHGLCCCHGVAHRLSALHGSEVVVMARRLSALHGSEIVAMA